MYKLNLFQDTDGVWCYSFTQNHSSKYYINFPLQLALICQGQNIIGPDTCGNCSYHATIEDKLVTLCSNCTEMVCVNELEKYKCECNSSNNNFQEDFKEILNQYKKDGFYTRGCNMHNCIFKSYLDETDFMTKTEKKQINNSNINCLENISYISDSNSEEKDEEDSEDNKLETSISTIHSENENINSSVFIDLTDEDDDEIEGEIIVYKPNLPRRKCF